MRCFFLHIICFLLCSILGYGQAEFNFSIPYDGEGVSLTATIEETAISKFNSNTISINRENLKNKDRFDIRLSTTKEFPLECSSENIKKVICRSEIPKRGVNIKIIMGNKPNRKSTVTFKIFDPNEKKKELVAHTINIQLTQTTLPKEEPEPTITNRTTTPVTVKSVLATVPCSDKTYNEKLICLKDLRNRTLEVKAEIEELQEKKNEIDKELNSFKKERNGNTYKIICECKISDYTISKPNGELKSRGKYWKIENLTKDFKVTIKHKSWKSLSKKIQLYSSTPAKTDVPEVEKEVTQNEPKNPLLDKEPPINNDSVSQVTIDVESEVPSESTDNKADIKKHWWLIIIVLPVLFLLMRGLTKPKFAPDDIVEDTLPVDAPKQADNTSEMPEIQIQEIEKSAEEAAAKLPLTQLEKSDDFVRIDLTKCWKNTIVSKLFFSKESILEIAEMVGTQNAYEPSKQSVDELSEIGGFLLGHFYPQKNGEYYVSVSTFVPITPEINDRYTVKFGDEAWVELDDAYKNHPGERLVGWFHTHPGHGLFLSNADIKVHTDAFPEKYQFAMEIDPTTPGYDMAFFTWKKDNTLNNQKDRIPPRWNRLKVLESHSKEK